MEPVIKIDKDDLKEMEELIRSPHFADFLLSNTTSFSAAACILETLLNKVSEIKKELEIE